MSRALDVARAALMEVGADPNSVYVDANNRMWRRAGAPLFTDRAGWLGIMAAYGPNHLVRCCGCRPLWRDGRAPCTPVRDVLRGVRCDR